MFDPIIGYFIQNWKFITKDIIFFGFIYLVLSNKTLGDYFRKLEKKSLAFYMASIYLPILLVTFSFVLWIALDKFLPR